jgi:hypothetical protein
MTTSEDVGRAIDRARREGRQQGYESALRRLDTVADCSALDEEAFLIKRAGRIVRLMGHDFDVPLPPRVEDLP